MKNKIIQRQTETSGVVQRHLYHPCWFQGAGALCQLYPYLFISFPNLTDAKEHIADNGSGQAETASNFRPGQAGCQQFDNADIIRIRFHQPVKQIMQNNTVFHDLRDVFR